jgi:uncharacterized membrane protein YbhN (UPF0104 family)
VAALACFLAILPLWAAQWRLLAPPADGASFPCMLGVVAMTSTVLNTTPLLVGEAAAVVFLVGRAGLSRGAALSVLAMDQLFVGVAKLCVLAGAAWVAALPLWMERGAKGLLGGVALLTLGLAALAWRGDRLPPWPGGTLPARGRRLLTTLRGALAPLRSPTRSGGALGLALAKKLAEVLAILCMQRAFGLDVAASSALVVLAAINLATLLPVVPANAGVYEGAVVVAYSWLGVAPALALGLALVQHACFFLALALPGYRWLARAPVAPRTRAVT